ncbi:BTAD domain-containing putative transcriptional regulator [Streptomyces sp. NPDC005828]|uniref:AfsR/SARP family transcriptional regulator n=1 Tax=Streptomyces sp. NPDC005828 TaxID=3157071 RepID=UPI0033FEC7FB
MEIRVNGELRTPTAPMARRVLALLVIHADRVVPTEQFIDELWGERPPLRARKTVQTYIYQLRKALSGDEDSGGSQNLVETHPHGYRLLLRGCRLDVRDFKLLVREGRDALARGRASEGAAALRSGLALWRGTALEDLETGPVLAAQAAKLESLRIQALEQRNAAALALGGGQELLEEIRDLTYDHPINEEFCAQLMMAAKRCGQQGEALAAYARLRRAMAEQLGLEPSPRLQELQSRALSGRDGEHPADRRGGGAGGAGGVGDIGAPFQLPPAIVDFVGRRDELDRVERGLRQPCAPSVVRIATVTGAPGVGKTELALQAAHRLRKHFPDGQLKVGLHLEDGTAQHPAEALKGLLAAVGYERHTLPEETGDLSRLFRGWAAGRRFLLLLDDAACANQIRPLLPAGPENAVIVTSRCRLPGLPGTVTSVALESLAPADGTTLLAQVLGDGRVAREPAAAAAIVLQCEGMPTAIRAIGSRITAWPGHSLADFAARLGDEQHRLEELSGPHLDVRRYLVDSAERLPGGAREVLYEIGRSGRADITVAHLARALRRSVSAVERLVEHLVAFHMLRPVMRDGDHVLSVSPLLRLAFARTAHPAPVPTSAPQGLVLCGGVHPVAA